MVALSPAEAGQRLTPESGNGSAGSLPQLTARDLFRECAATTRRIKSLRAIVSVTIIKGAKWVMQ